MERTERKLSLDVHKTVSTASVSLKKGDTAHRLLITLSEGGYPYHISEDCTVAFSALKPDGTAIFNDCRIEGDTVIYDMTEQTTAEEGMVSCEIQIYGANGDLLTSASFLLFVEEGVNNRGAVVSSGEFSTLVSMVREVNRATSHANRATERANKAAAACMVIGSASGDMIHLDDAIDAPLVGMRIFGKTTQSGAPTPVNPATLISVGYTGSINLTSNEQTITVPTPGGLRGIPVATGGNYTDSNGQQWICDEVNLGRGVYLQRCFEAKVTPEMFRNISSYGDKGYHRVAFTLPRKGVQDGALSQCSHFRTSVAWEGSNDHSYVAGDVGYIFSNRWTTKEEVAAWLDSQSAAGAPVTFVYALETPIETDIADEVLDAYSDYIQAYSDNTVVTNDSGAHMALEYIMDAKKYIDKMISTGIHAATLE